MKKRLVWFFAALLFAFSGVIVRISQLIEDETLQTAQGQSSVTVTVAQARGTIYDRHLNRLTNKATQYRAGIISTPEAMAVLSEALTEEEWVSLSERLQSGKPVVQVFESAMAPVTGISQFATPVRYDDEQLAAHVIGYLGADGTEGVSGIEKALNDRLNQIGGAVTVTYQTDGNGRALQGGEITVENTLYRANAGVALTLDARIQNMVEKQAAPLLDKGAVVVLEPETGAIVAMASFPDFEPTNLEAYLTAEGSPLFNRATASYNCGSVFKIVSSAAALEAGVPVSQTFDCSGRITVGSNVIKCHHVLGHGTQTLTK
ncbi:MAG: penicillin-binding protein 2, partial [Clostridia bacterium]|nr:penicillin-binding protein 2 [Clostridia bacterium]